CASNVCRRPPLPCTWISPPSSCLRRATASATSPSSRRALFQESSRSVREATSFGRLFRAAAASSAGSVAFGQEAAKISYVLRPSRNAPACFVHPVMMSANVSSKYGTSQPPCRKPPSRSSSGAPGACMTPSIDTKLPTTSLRTLSLLQLRWPRNGMLVLATIDAANHSDDDSAVSVILTKEESSPGVQAPETQPGSTSHLTRA